MTRCQPLTCITRYLLAVSFSLLTAHCLLLTVNAQSVSATLSGTVKDTNGAVIPGVTITVTNNATGAQRQTTTNAEGYFVVPLLPPSRYQITAQNQGFTTVRIPEVVLNVGDQKALQIQLKAGDINATVQVINEAPLINESPAVGTVVDRNLAENIPMNGRSFQTLIQLTPGVVLTVSSVQDSGQFSVNGQRAASNYWTVDGVGANIGVSSQGGNGLAGALGSFSAQGGTNSLVSVDAMQEFRIQTSTYAPEFGRTPGAQISIITRSGANQFHGTAFDYFRNDVFDATDWFANANRLPKAKERQNDFGGTFSGPIRRNRTFFFFSGEWLRLRLPVTALKTVPDLQARQNAVPALQPFLNAYPLPNGPDNLATGVAQFNSSFSNPSKLNAYSLRIDHNVTSKFNLFGRYNDSPSETQARGGGGNTALSVVSPNRITTRTGTVGFTWLLSSTTNNDFRFNYSSTRAEGSWFMDNFGGAIPLSSLPLPSGFTDQNAQFAFTISTLNGVLTQGQLQTTQLHQINIVDSLSMQKGPHTLKFGIDFRRLTPLFGVRSYSQQVTFSNVSSAGAGNLFFASVAAGLPGTLLFRNLGVFGQDTWRLSTRLTVTYGLRWDIDFSPSSINGPSLVGVTGFSQNTLSNLALAPSGTAPFKTGHGVAPRLGLAYQLRQSQAWQTVLRGGFGVFYDLATQEVGNQIFGSAFPFGGNKNVFGGSFPLNAAAAAPPPITPPGGGIGSVNAFDPNLKLPYTMEWNAAVEQAIGAHQTISASYVGAAGRRLIQTALVFSPNPSFQSAQVVTNAGSSNYQALQIQFQRRARGLQTLASYTWAHSIDDSSAGSAFGNLANVFVAGFNSNANRGPSDFDIRHSLTVGLTYDLPIPKTNNILKKALSDWSVETFVVARTAPPVQIQDARFFRFANGSVASVRPDVVPGQPFYLFGSQYPGGKAFNPSAFTDPPLASPGVPSRQGTLGRNVLRGFGAAQWDFAVHRTFPIHESVKLQFRAEMFNLLNHPNFGQPSGLFGTGGFGLSQAMLGTFLGGTSLTGGTGASFSPLYQIGGPRSIQFALKLTF